MALNLSRATRLFVSTVQDETAGSHNNTNTWEVPTLDGYSFSQDAETQTITLNEAGEAPVRGQKLFNIALNPAEISFPTYVRPTYKAADIKGNVADVHSAVEAVLWEAMVGNGKAPAQTTPAVGTYVQEGASYMEATFKGSNVHELLKVYLFFQLDNTTYRINDFAINSAEFDFSIDAIAQINWSGQGQTVDEVDTNTWVAGTNYLGSNNIGKNSLDAEFIKNKLSTITLQKVTGLTSGQAEQAYTSALTPTNLNDTDGASTYTVDVQVDGGTVQTVSIDSSAAPWSTNQTVATTIAEMNYQLDGCVVFIEDSGADAGKLIFKSTTAGTTSSIDVTAGVTDLLSVLENGNAIGALTETNGTGTGTPTVYNVPITGGSLTIENNVTYLTPEELGKVNIPIAGGFTGTRSVSGTVTAYLNTGAANTGGLLTDLINDTDTVTQEFEMKMSMGGGANTPRVDFFMNHAALVIPTINVEDVLATEIGFTALGDDIDQTDELVVRYVATAV